MADSFARSTTRVEQERADVHTPATWTVLLPLLTAAIMLGLGLWLRWSNLNYRGLPTQGDYNNYAFNHFGYTDIVSLYYRDKLIERPRPYFDYPFEYPVGLGLLVYALNAARRMQAYFLWTSTFLAACGLAIAWLIPRFPRGRVWLLALSPALAFYVNLNWDMWPVLLTVIALLLFVRGRDGWGAAVLTAAIWTKFFPIVILPLILAERARLRRWRAAGRIAAGFGLVSVVMNAPLLVVRPRAWLYFFEQSRIRGREVNLWNLFDRWKLTTARINTLSFALLVAGLAVFTLMVWRGRKNAFLPASCAALAWFFFVNKVYSPQYSLWVVVLLAVAGAAPAVAAAWSAADLLYFAASFLILGLTRFGNAPTSWFYARALFPAMVIREGMLLVVAGWCLWRIYTDRRAALDPPVSDY
jgi:hypothetical protein